MFSEQAIRLLRETWPNATMLAEELYAMFQGSVPLTHRGPITIINSSGDAPALTVKSPPTNPTSPPFQITGNDGTSSTVNVSNGDVTFINNVTNTQQTNFGGTTTVVQGGTTAERQVFMGTILSGTGNSYTVSLLDGATVPVTQQSINASETIPAGSRVVVVKRDNGSYVMQFPTWVQ